MPLRCLFALILLLPFQVSLAASINVTDLPLQLQDCVQTNGCVISAGSSYSFNGMDAFYYVDDPAGAARTGYAIRYRLTSPSGRYSNSGLSVPFTDYLWLTVYDSYNLAPDAAPLTVYTDTVSPAPGNLMHGDSDGLDISVEMQNAALLAASAYRLVGLDADLNSIDKGTMSVLGDAGDPALLPCLAEDCYAQARLNLLYLSFSDNGNGIALLTFNAADSRALLYEVRLYDPYGYDPDTMDYTGVLTRQSYYIAAVPLPAAIWLFVSGAGLLGLLVRCFRN